MTISPASAGYSLSARGVLDAAKDVGAAIFLNTNGSDGVNDGAGALVAGDTAAGAAANVGHPGTNVNELFVIAVTNEERA